ncbi:phage portal family protein [Escherichia coli 2-316-03_S4_C2]|nr:phage portal family protein [Escherichia coli 2-316-03_S4_C2]
MSNNVKLQVLLRAVDQASRPFKSIRTASRSLSGDIRETQKSLRELNGHASRIRENMVKSKGRNNFKNLFLYAPQGKADGIKIIPLSEVATKDDFFNIKKASAADLLDAHRIPFQLMGGKPENVGSLGDIEKVAKVFVRNELIPLQDRIREINGWLGQEVIRFKNYSLDTDNG